MSDDAKFYQDHKDDPEVWDEPEPRAGRKPERRRLNAMVSIRLTPEEEDALRAAAEQKGVSLSAFVRESILRELAPRSARSLIELLKSSTEAARSESEVRLSSEIAITSAAEVELRKLGA